MNMLGGALGLVIHNLKIKITSSSLEDMEKFRGIIPPVVTPFDEDGNVDYDLFREEVKRIIDVGVNGIAIGGSTGEGHTLSDGEFMRLIELAIEVRGRRNFLVIAGIITNSVHQVVERALGIKNLNVDALMITPPHYLFNAGDEGNYVFYKEIYEKTKLPIIIYNVVPWNVVSVNVIEKLAKEGVIVGIKQSGGNIHVLADLLVKVRNVPILTALDDMLFPSFIMGSSGSIAAINTLLPRTSVRLFNAVANADYETARSIHEELLPIARFVIMQPDMPTRLKFVMNNAGWRVGYPRKPLLPKPPQDIVGKLQEISRQVQVLERE